MDKDQELVQMAMEFERSIRDLQVRMNEMAADYEYRLAKLQRQITPCATNCNCAACRFEKRRQQQGVE